MIKLTQKISEYNRKRRKYDKKSQKDVEKFFKEKVNLSRTTRVKNGSGGISDLWHKTGFVNLIVSTPRYLPNIKRSEQIKVLEDNLDGIKNLSIAEDKADINLGKLFRNKLNINVQNAEELYDLIFEKIIKPMEEYKALIRIQEEVKELIESVLTLAVKEESANQLKV